MLADKKAWEEYTKNPNMNTQKAKLDWVNVTMFSPQKVESNKIMALTYSQTYT